MKVVLTAVLSSLFAFCLPATAQVVSPGDEAGRIEQRFERPLNPKSKLALREGLEATVPPDQAEKIILHIRAIRFEGNTSLKDATLKRIAARLQGKKVSLRDVFDVAAEVTTAYGKAGFTLSRAIVPPQELEPSGATVTIRLIEGYVDQVQWPDELNRYRDMFSRYSESITAERPVRIKTIERYLLLANDLPGLKLSSRLIPSQTNPAASTLIVTVEEEKQHSAAVLIDNRGTEGSGPYQGQVIGTLSNLFGLHEEISLSYIIAGPKHNKRTPELNYLSFSYSQILNSEGLKFDLSGNASWGEPGTPNLLLLDYETKSLNVTGQFSYPLIRTRDTNLTGVVAMDWKNSESSIFGVPENADRLRIFRAEVSFDHADAQRGINQLFFSVSQGIDGLGSTENGNTLASRANGKVDFLKISARASRLQNFYGGFSGLLSASGQLSADPLLSSQECGFGGGSMGRGFQPSVISGDHCLMALAELRYDAETLQFGLEKFQPYVFADFGSVWNIDVPAGTPEQDEAASIGAGLRFGWKHFEADLQVSYQVDRPNSVTVDDRVGVFFDFSARF